MACRVKSLHINGARGWYYICYMCARDQTASHSARARRAKALSQVRNGSDACRARVLYLLPSPANVCGKMAQMRTEAAILMRFSATSRFSFCKHSTLLCTILYIMLLSNVNNFKTVLQLDLWGRVHFTPQDNLVVIATRITSWQQTSQSTHCTFPAFHIWITLFV